METNRKTMTIIIVVVVIFPILITLVVSKVNVNKKAENFSSGKIIVVNYGCYIAEMDMEDFIPCVLMAQMPINSPIEALKAQAVVIRTYILKQMNNETKISSDKLGLPFISYGKLEDIWFREYRLKHPRSFGGMLGNLTGLGKSRIFENNMKYLDTIMEKTRKQVLRNGSELILPLFHGISNGTTRDGSELLGDDYRYLKSVICNTDMQQENFISVKYVSLEELKNKLSQQDIVIYDNNKELFTEGNMDVQDFMKLIDYSDKDKTGYLVSIKIADTKIPAQTFADALGLTSTSMEINEYEKGIRITTKGEGHGFGMSLAYASQLAKDGMNWQKILKYFYDATIVEY